MTNIVSRQYHNSRQHLTVTFANGAKQRVNDVTADEATAVKFGDVSVLTGKAVKVFTRVARTYEAVVQVAVAAGRVARTYDFTPRRKVVLIACVSQKASAPCEASALFVSRWFTKARDWAVAHGYEYYVLSAQHGLLAPTDVARPYNLTIAHMPKRGRVAWGEEVAAEIKATIATDATLIMFGGVHYRDALLPNIVDAYRVELPLLHKGIGQQEQWLAATAR